MSDAFLNQLNNLRSGNFLGGVERAAAADLLARQSNATTDVVNKLNEQLNALEPGLKTTEQQAEAVSEDPAVQSGLADIEAEALNLQKANNRIATAQAQQAAIYGEALGALGAIGGLEAKSAMEALAKRFEITDQSLLNQSKALMQNLKYKEDLLNISSKEFQMQTDKIKLEELKRNIPIVNLSTKMASSPLLSDVLLAFNQDTGLVTNRGRNFDFGDLRDKMFKTYGDKAEFADAWVLLKEGLQKNMKAFNPPDPKAPDNTAFVNAREKLKYAQDRYIALSQYSEYAGSMLVGGAGEIAREEYREAFARVRPGERFDPDIYFSDRKVINEMAGGSYGKQDAEQMYDIFWNKNSKDYYWNHFKNMNDLMFQNGRRVKEGGQPKYMGYGDEVNLVDPVTGESYRFDAGNVMRPNEGIITGRDGYGQYNPYNPKTYQHYSYAKKIIGDEIEVDNRRKEKESKRKAFTGAVRR